MKILYSAKATTTGGREGHVESSDGILNFDIRTPKALGGQDGYTNPEQLFAAGYSACFDSALNLVIRTQKIKTGETSVTAEVGIGKSDNASYGLSVTLHANIPGVSEEEAKKLTEKAHQVCPYSNATRNNITVNIITTNK